MKTNLFILLLLICLSIPFMASAQTVYIPDPNLRAAIKFALSGNSDWDRPFTELEEFSLTSSSVSNLTGLEHAINLEDLNLQINNISNLSPLAGLTNLTELWLHSNSISDISPLAGLTNLTYLRLEVNRISDISPLAGLTNLTRLSLYRNLISDISPLAGLTNLTGLSLDNNRISDISPLAGLTQLATLGLSINNISDISPLAGLTNLTYLALGDNNISDISPLAGLTNLTYLYLSDNNISDLSVLAGLTKLIQLRLSGNRILDLSPLAGLTKLTQLRLSSNRISGISPLASLTNLTELDLRYNSISDISPLVGLTNLTWLLLDGNPLDVASIKIHIPALRSRGVTVEFDDLIPEADIPDPNLRAAVEKRLGKAPGDIITREDIATLIDLSARNASIGDLTGLEFAINLTTLDLGENSISDITPLQVLRALTNSTNLTTLNLESNRISGIEELAGLTNLTELYLGDNRILQLSPLAFLTNLTTLNLEGNGTWLYVDTDRILDLSHLAFLTNLTTLNLGRNRISDISSLAGLTKLTQLTLSGNNISDLSPLAGLTNLTHLGLDDTNISDLSPLMGLTNLTTLILSNNSISDLSPLLNMGWGSGDVIDVRQNPLNVGSIETYIPVLQNRGVTVKFDSLLPVKILEPSLLAAIEKALGKAPGDPITAADLANLTKLRVPNAHISDLTGLEGAINLTDLILPDNSISDLSPLVGLTNLTALALDNNSISDLSPLAGLTNLTTLWLGNNPIPISDLSLLADLTKLTTLGLESNSISDLSPLAGVTSLTRLFLGNNSISDLSSLVGLTKLTTLILYDNSISNISPLAGLTNLTDLSLSNNAISDLSPLVANTGLGEGDTVDVSENPLNKVSIHTHIPALQARGVTVEFDNVITESVTIPDPNLRAAIEKAFGKASGATITTADMAKLTDLRAPNANISNLTGLEGATNLTRLNLGAEYVEAEGRSINSNSVSNLSPISGLTSLTSLHLDANNISDISAVTGLTQLTNLSLGGNNISDLSPLVANTGLGSGDMVNVRGNPLNRASIQTHIPALQNRDVTVEFDNVITEPVNIPDSNLRAAIETALGKASGDTITTVDMANLTRLEARNANIGDFTGLEFATNLTWLEFRYTDITDVSALVAVLSNLPALTSLKLNGNKITDISQLSGLTNLTELHLSDNNISDLSPLVENTGLGEGATVDVSENPLNNVSMHTHIPALQSRGVDVRFENLKPVILEHPLLIPAGINLIHAPLKVTAVDGVAQTITSIADLYDALGGADTVNFLITYDPNTQAWLSYFTPTDKGTAADKTLTDDLGIIIGMKTPTSIHLQGETLGTNGSSTITLTPGLNLVGLPLNDSSINRVSDLFALDGISGNVQTIIVSDNGEFKTVGRAGDPGDISITGGHAFILIAQQAATVTISGDGWTHTSETTAAPLVRNSPLQADTTPVLALTGAIVDEETGLNKNGFRVTVKNLSTGRAGTGMTRDDEKGYRLTVVEVETARAATVGDSLEISAQSPNPFIGVEPVRYTVTADDVKWGRIQLPELVLYEISAETELLANYPNPFNPETWIPYRLAEDDFVTLTIYDGAGQVVRTFEIGHRIAAVYESQSKAVYWDGRNEGGESVASGVYFYHLSAGTYSATRKMLILK